MSYDLSGFGEARDISDILQMCFTKRALVLTKHLFSAIFESVGKDDFLKN